jgi:hypothetical protein
MRSRHGRIRNLVIFLFSSSLSIVTAALVGAHLTGPPPGYTGAPGEETCAATGCHTPPAIMPETDFGIFTELIGGDTSRIRVDAVINPLQHSLPLGFQVTILDTSNQPVGGIILDDPVRTQVMLGSMGRTYVSHTQQGAVGDNCSNCERWTFRWVQPTPLGDRVIIYAAGCITDGNSGPDGDVVLMQTQSFFHFGSCVVHITGDINGSGVITSADIIGLIGYVFKSGSTPLPCAASGDVNCNGTVDASDIIELVNFVFKSGTRPCDACTSPLAAEC